MNGYVKYTMGKSREMYENWMKKRDASLVFPEDVEEFRDIPYLPDGLDVHRMDVYRPKSQEQALPVLLNFHGGGMTMCSKEFNRPFCAQMAKRGFVVFCLNYPLVPDQDVPGILGDVCAGMDGVDDLLERFGGDRKRVFLSGDSAGAFLAVYAVAVQGNEAIAAAAGVKPSRLPVKGLGLISGMFHTADSGIPGLFLRKDYYGPDWKRHPLLPWLKPEKPAVAELMRPCILVTSQADQLRKSTLRFYDGLKSQEIPCELLDFPKNRKLMHDFSVTFPDWPESERVMDKIAAFLQKLP